MKFAMAAFGLAFLAGLSAAQAQDLVGEAGGWEIWRDAGMGGGCYMASAFEDGTLVQVGFDLEEDASFMAVFNADWTDITDGETYPLTFTLDEQTWTADGHGLNTGEAGGILVMIENEEFLSDLALKNTLSLSNDAGEVARLDLAGTRDAVIATAECIGAE
ncbi:hypothetical protein [Pseudogemmobacter humi]|uniref:Invasion associated locus B (IalB) protein n=1 Tax=Pseudogemmobacter humi TaxID=2483812 RepID=A0A3P5XEL3_9RHOB|nr:hypothetical protein [Pseudogemmobacter humi]VDC33242.1 hypothetical protein XINFAN_03725 [Pseudogemmobacter humi]